MAKNKLKHFAELDTFEHVIQHPYQKDNFDHPLKGLWNTDFFNQAQPITLEVGCGKGEYTVGLARMHSERNYLGLDLKGNRIWRGARTALDEGMQNVGFIRSQADRIPNFFAPGELSEIWVTFPDPKPKKGDARKRLTSTENNERYRNLLAPGGMVHLKTDSDFNVEFTLEVIRETGAELIRYSDDIDRDFPDDELVKIRTYYEIMFRKKNVPIKLISYRP
jgi:tRNA (guanine-N7-)-methyltransferase